MQCQKVLINIKYQYTIVRGKIVIPHLNIELRKTYLNFERLIKTGCAFVFKFRYF